MIYATIYYINISTYSQLYWSDIDQTFSLTPTMTMERHFLDICVRMRYYIMKNSGMVNNKIFWPCDDQSLFPTETWREEKPPEFETLFKEQFRSVFKLDKVTVSKKYHIKDEGVILETDGIHTRLYTLWKRKGDRST